MNIHVFVYINEYTCMCTYMYIHVCVQVLLYIIYNVCVYTDRQTYCFFPTIIKIK